MTAMYQNDTSGELPPEIFETGIAVVGMACRVAGARSVQQYWANLRDGIESIRTFSDAELIGAGVDPAMLARPNYVRAGAPLEDMECFDAALFGLSRRDAAIMDPQHRHFLECSWEALENAGHDPARFTGAIGVFGGSGHNAYLARNLLTNPKLVREVGPFLLRHTGNDKDFLTTRVSYLLDLKGPSINVQTACSTSLVAIHTAIQSLLASECDMALAGGASIELPHRQGYVYQEGEILSPDGHCRPFDASSQGTVFGSGVGIVVLRRLADAIKDRDHIYAVIRGSAINNDGSGKVGYLAPSVDGQAGVISEALSIAEVDARSVGYVEAHGTGTPVGDPIEVAALTQAYRRDTAANGYCALGSVKANIGHTDTAAGAASLIKVALALHHRELPPSLNYAAANPACDLASSPFAVNTSLRAWPRGDTPRRAGVSSLGVGGTNAHAVLEEAPRRASAPSRRDHQLLALSAASATALDGNAAALAAHMAVTPVSLADAAYTLSIGRRALARRRIVVAANPGDAAAALSDPGRMITGDAVADRRTAFMFCGAGSQYAGMGAGLYASEPVFRAAVDAGLAEMEAIGCGEVRRCLLQDAADDEARQAMERPSIALPALFIVQVALARLWMHWGVQPSGMIGHSSGEYAAAHLAGVIGLRDALRVVHTRGRLFETLPQGGMLSVPLPEDALRPMLPAGLSIAAINGPSLCIVSGEADAIARLHDELAERDVESQRVRIAVAAHSPMLDPVLDAFRACLATVRLSAPTVPFVSNLTGLWITPEQATDREYWVRHLRQTVRFTDGLQQLFADETQVLLEVGPGRTMASLARQHPARARAQPVVNSLRHANEDGADLPHMLTALGRLWTLGVDVDWHRFWADEERARVPLPTYQFDRERHWIEPGTVTVLDEAAADEPLERKPDLADWFYEPVWRRSRRPSFVPATGAALVFLDCMGLGAAIAARLRAGGIAVATVRPGRRFDRQGDAFTIDPRSPADYRRLIAALAAEDRWLEQIFHSWLVTGQSWTADPMREARALQDAGLYSLLFLAQALGEEDVATPVRLLMISDRMQRISTERGLIAAKATALGACRVVAREQPMLGARSVDVDLSADSGSLAELMVAEAASNDDAETVAYRAGERWVQSFEAAPRPVGDGGLQLRARGTYLITGGLGGLGLTVARHLADSCARLVLVARTAMPPRETWDDQLAARPAGDPVRGRMATILAIEAAGGEVMVVQADVADARAMRRVVRQVRARFGAIHGIFHAAGVLDDGVVQLKTRDAVDAVLAPKLYGTLALEAALADERPDFVLLFSSISAMAGLVGQVDYAAANAFLDSYAEARHGRAGPRVISVGWSQWGEVGMAASLAAAAGDSGVPEPIGTGRPIDHPFLNRLYQISAGEVVVDGRLSPEADWLLDEHRLANGQALIPGTGYLEIARAAHAAVAAGPAELSEVSFLAPFAVPTEGSRDLRVHLRQRDGRWRFGIYGQPSNEPGWEEHARGWIGPAPQSEPNALALNAIEARCSAVKTADPADSAHLRFGPRWRNLRTFAHGRNEALLRLALSDAFAGDVDTLALHPALLDFATAGAQALIPGHDPATDFFVPLSYGQVCILRPLPAAIVSHVRYRAGAGGSASLAVFDITISDGTGAVLAEIAEFTMIKVRDPALLAGTAARATRASADTGRPRLESLTPGEGISVIERVLQGEARPHLLVSPHPLSAAIARLRPTPRTARATVGPVADDEAAPRTATEQMIATMWGDMLGVDAVRRTDDFFDLGGHSLLAVQFINRLRKRAGRTLPLAALLETPTVERLAALLDPEGAASAVCGTSPCPVAADADHDPIAPAITIRPGTGPALFLIHDGLGETLLYRSMALRLSPGRAVYGLEPVRGVDGRFLHTSIADMAADYIARIRRVQPEGPYLIAGLCAGGVIAFEMACQLRAAGDAVPFVGILDAADVEAAGRRFHAMRERWSRFRRAIVGESLIEAAPLFWRKAVNTVRWEIGSRLERGRRTRAVSEWNAPGGPAPDLGFLHLYEVAHRAHRPSGLFDGGDVVLFRATDGNGAEEDMPFAERYSDCILGWGKRVADEVLLVPVPGGHASLLQEPHVEITAARLQAALDTALARWSTNPERAPEAPVPAPADLLAVGSAP